MEVKGARILLHHPWGIQNAFGGQLSCCGLWSVREHPLGTGCLLLPGCPLQQLGEVPGVPSVFSLCSRGWPAGRALPASPCGMSIAPNVRGVSVSTWDCTAPETQSSSLLLLEQGVAASLSLPQQAHTCPSRYPPALIPSPGTCPACAMSFLMEKAQLSSSPPAGEERLLCPPPRHQEHAASINNHHPSRPCSRAQVCEEGGGLSCPTPWGSAVLGVSSEASLFKENTSSCSGFMAKSE